MNIKLSQFEQWKDAKLTVEDNEKIMSILGKEMFLKAVGISGTTYSDLKYRASKKGTFNTCYIFKLCAFLRDNNVSDEEIEGVING